MADAVCGPSNPLQNFQKLSSVDRTLQQDRLTSRAGPSQGFRSDPGRSAGLLDPEFEAFQAGYSPGLIESQHSQNARQTFHQRPPMSASQYPGSSVGWASDFQRLNISHSPSPPPQSQLPSQTAVPAWHLDFQRQQQAPSLRQQQPLQQTPQFQHYQPSYNFSPMTQYPLGQQIQPNAHNSLLEASQHPIQDDTAAFEQHFKELEDLEVELELQRAGEQPTELGQDILLGGPDVLQNSMQPEDIGQEIRRLQGEVDRAQERLDRQQKSGLENREISSEKDLAHTMDDVQRLAESRRELAQKIDDTAKAQEEQHRAAGDEDLARTAGELLERVADDMSTKFRESSFLSLMAQLRDREVRVEGNEIVSNDDRAETVTESINKPATVRQRPSSVPPRRNIIGLDEGSGSRDFRMAGALHDGDVSLDNSGIGPSASHGTVASSSNAAGCFFGKDMEMHDFS